MNMKYLVLTKPFYFNNEKISNIQTLSFEHFSISLYRSLYSKGGQISRPFSSHFVQGQELSFLCKR